MEFGTFTERKRTVLMDTLMITLIPIGNLKRVQLAVFRGCVVLVRG
jgi:hypothetical protein